MRVRTPQGPPQDQDRSDTPTEGCAVLRSTSPFCDYRQCQTDPVMCFNMVSLGPTRDQRSRGCLLPFGSTWPSPSRLRMVGTSPRWRALKVGKLFAPLLPRISPRTPLSNSSYLHTRHTRRNHRKHEWLPRYVCCQLFSLRYCPRICLSSRGQVGTPGLRGNTYGAVGVAVERRSA